MSVITPNGERINQFRIKSGLSLRGLSKKTKIHYSTLSNVEKVKGTVTPKTAKAICDALNQEFDQLFEIVDSSKEV